MCALRQAAGCVEAGPEPAASQQDRRGSRWICLDLTLPTPLHPPGPPLPTCTSLCSVKSSSREGEFVLGGWAVYVLLLVPSRESRKRDRNQAEHKRDFVFADFSSQTLCVDIRLLSPCWNFWSALFLCCVSFALSLVHSASCSLSQTHALLVCPGNVLPSSFLILSHHWLSALAPHPPNLLIKLSLLEVRGEHMYLLMVLWQFKHTEYAVLLMCSEAGSVIDQHAPKRVWKGWYHQI